MKNYRMAEICLFAAQAVMDPNEEEELQARLNLSWGKLYMERMKNAYERMRKTVENGPLVSADTGPGAASFQPDSSTVEGTTDQVDAWFSSLNLPEPSIYRKVFTYDEALPLFKKGMEWYNAAKEYYVLDGFVSEHVSILEDMSWMYRMLAFWEKSPQRALAMHKRRAGFLEPVVEQINPRAYDTLWKQVTFELGEIYREMMDIKLHSVYSIDEEYMPEKDLDSARRINEYGTKGIKYYILFITSFKDQTGNIPDPVPPENEHLFLSAKFYMARIYSRQAALTREQAVQGLKQALDLYRWLVAYHSRNKTKVFLDEIEVCRQMEVGMIA